MTTTGPATKRYFATVGNISYIYHSSPVAVCPPRETHLKQQVWYYVLRTPSSSLSHGISTLELLLPDHDLKLLCQPRASTHGERID